MGSREARARFESTTVTAGSVHSMIEILLLHAMSEWQGTEVKSAYKSTVDLWRWTEIR
jgi:hypothetical protein